ncbi:hypothetical protein A9798_01720 [Edwardsiella hoshinae]|uniref:VIT family protein n=1 Tax=Edwardsiella hoshinae TaxID=93378 RepID=A0A376D7P5_9GAMM|nr:hypothetical protein [Edwardsiella hoshinae]AOV95789.1 hypothetical protein A9798_01720 [Edwardsiella hoshinae]QPR28367.1 hypothetical protein I6G97_01570 [Edwardsiella hoshinae]STC83630.1 Uncharacterised protein [Edwardsiella hoshinae]
MRLLRREHHNYNLVALLGGAVSGTMSAALLAIGTLWAGAAPLARPMLLTIGAVSVLSSAFAFLLSHYAGLRDDLLHAERQLNLTASGRLASGILGRKIWRQAWHATLYTALAYVFCFSLPFLAAWPFPQVCWLPAAITLLLIVVMALLLARVMRARRWATLGVVSVGFVLCAVIGALLRYR